jgi:hypothetical protein
MMNFLKSRGKNVKNKTIIWCCFMLCFIIQSVNAQDLTISTAGETGTSGTNWSIIGNELTVTGTATVNVSVITNHLETVGNLEVVANSAVSVQHIFIEGAINFTGNVSRTLTFVARNDVRINNSISATNTSLHLIAKAGDNIEVSSTFSITSNGGNIVLWANTDGNNLGNIAIQPTSSIVSNGGGVWMGGGQTSTQWVPFEGASSIVVGAASAISGVSNPFGVVIRGTVNAGTGNFYASGVSNKASTDYSTGVFFDANPDNINIQAKNIRVIGQGSPNTGAAHSNRGVVLEIAANKSGTIQATSELYMEGVGSGISSTGSYNRGIHLAKNSSGTATITAPTIYLKGTGVGASGSNFNDGVSLFGITVGNSQTTSITIEGIAGAFGAASRAINFQENVTIGNQSSSAAIQLLGNSFAYNNSVIATQGSVSILSTTNSFSGTCSNASLSITGSPSSITIGKPTNTASVTISNPLTAAGSITIIGGLLNVGSVITSSNTGDITMKSNVTNSGATSSLFTNAQILKTGGQRSKVLMQCNGRLNFGTSAKIEATNTALDAIFWSDFDNSNDDGGTTVYGDIITNGGHVWIGGSNSTGGAVTWNGLTVGDGPSIGTLGSTNWNALDLGSNITTSGGDMFIWSGSGHSSGISGIEVYNGDRNLNAGSGDVTIITNAGVRGAALRVNTSGKIAIAPNATSFSASTFNFNGTLSGNDFIGTNSMDKINILNYAAVNQLSLGYYMNANGWNFSNNGPVAINIDYVTNGSLRFNGSTIALNANLKTQNAGNLYLKGNTTIASGKYIECNGNFTQDGNLLFKSDATGTAAFGRLGGTFTTISGTTTVERFIPARRAFRFLSPSVTTLTTIRQNWQENGGTTSGLGTHITGATGASAGFDATETNNPSMFTFTNGIWEAVTNTNSNVLTAGTPYRLMVRGDRTISMATNTPTATNTTLRATGALYTGNFSPILNQTAEGFSFVGNPYQATIDIKTALQASTNVNKNVVYYWDPKINIRGGYIARNLQTSQNSINSDSNVNDYVQPGQAFFLVNESTLTGPPSLTLTENHKSLTNAAAGAFRNANTGEYGTMRVNLQANINNQWSTIEGSLAIFNDNFSWAVTSEDATKFANLDEEVSFMLNNTSLAIACQSNPSRTAELPIKIEKMRHNNYQWQFEMDNYEGESAYLFDASNNSYTAITNGAVVPFTADANTSNRFKIVFQTSALSTDDFGNNIKLYPNPAKAGASFYIDGITEATVSVYNVVGQNIPVTVMSQGNAIQVTPNAGLSKGVYLVSITVQGMTKQVKWIVE